jgi:hypothetical protein
VLVIAKSELLTIPDVSTVLVIAKSELLAIADVSTELVIAISEGDTTSELKIVVDGTIDSSTV